MKLHQRITERGGTEERVKEKEIVQVRERNDERVRK